MRSVLSIAGSDSSGGAGIQADIKTVEALHLFAQTALTAITAQNTLGVAVASDVDASLVTAQIDAVFADIRPDAVKVGMVSSSAIAHAIADALRAHQAPNIVVDPVMVATSGARLISVDALRTLCDELIPLASVITPNLPEAAVLSGMATAGDKEQEEIAFSLLELGCKAVLVKGGHRCDTADDVLVRAGCGEALWLRSPRIATDNTHGTGCTLSSAIACGLAQGLDIECAVRSAKEYVTGALKAGLDLGRGSGPLDHMWNNRLR